MSKSDERRLRIAARLRKIRAAKGFETAADFARFAGVAPGTYTHHDNGTRGLSASVAKKYARALDVPVSEFWEPEEDGEFPVLSETIAASEVVTMSDWRTIDIIERKGNKRAVQVPASRSGYVRRSVQIGDESVNKSIACGEFAMYVELDCDLADLVGRLVVIERRRAELVQRSIRRVREIEGGILTLVADSTDPIFLKETVFYPSKRPDEEVEIVGRVVGKHIESDDL